MPDHLRAAAARRSQEAAERVRRAFVEMTKVRTPISFTSVARQASVSTDFLDRHTELRTKIEALRQTPRQTEADTTAGSTAGHPGTREQWQRGHRAR
jgi:hypothetical protein